jgi:hypothetical protein
MVMEPGGIDPADPADAPPGLRPLAVGGRCEAATKRGGACPNAAPDGRRFCWLHDPERVAERREVLSERGRAGQRKRSERERARRAGVAERVALDSAASIRGALERALAAVEASDTDAIAKANATARIAATAITVLRTCDIESRLEELRRLVLERVPAGARLGGHP